MELKKMRQSWQGSRPGMGGLVLRVGLLVFVIWPVLIHAESRALRSTSEDTGSGLGSDAGPQTPQRAGIAQEAATWRIDIRMLLTDAGEPCTAEAARLITALESADGEGSPVSREELRQLLKRREVAETYHDKIIKYATPQSLAIQKQEHEDYTKRFLEDRYLKAGVQFLHDQHDLLARAENEFGVLQRDMVALLIWESGLGKSVGIFYEVNVFLGQILFLDAGQKEAVGQLIAAGKPNPLDDPLVARKERTRLDRRKSQAIANLAALLRYCKKEGQDPYEMKGSWGGAIGYVQFMPASMRYAIDADGDGRINLYSWPDAIMSAANYLKTVGHYALDKASRTRALLAYNPSKEYAAGVILVAEAVWQRYQNGE